VFYREGDKMLESLLNLNIDDLEERISMENMLLFQNREDIIMNDIYNTLVSNYNAKAEGRNQDIQTVCICQTFGIGKTRLLNELIPYIIKNFKPEDASQQEKNEFEDVFSNTLYIKFDFKEIDNGNDDDEDSCLFKSFSKNFTYYFLLDFFKGLSVDDKKLKTSVKKYSKKLFNKLVQLLVEHITNDIDLFGISEKDFFTNSQKNSNTLSYQ
jgi:hypothetical protein